MRTNDRRTAKHICTRLVALVAILLLVACNRTPSPPPITPVATDAAAAVTASSTGPSTESITVPPTVPPTVVPTVVQTVAPTVALPTVTPTFAAGTPGAAASTPGIATGNVTAGAIFTSPRFSYTVVLPCCWLALPTPGTAIETALAQLEEGEEMPLWGDLAERARERQGGALLELIALLPDEENVALPIAQMTVSVLPMYGLTLEDYAIATADELARIANTSVQTAYIESSLGVEEFPASVIEYTAAPTSTSGADTDQSIAGMQVAFFGHDAESLIVLTFTTTVDRFDGLQTEFLHIIRSVTLQDPAI